MCDDMDNVGCLLVAIRIGYPFISAKVVWVHKLGSTYAMGVKRGPNAHFAVIHRTAGWCFGTCFIFGIGRHWVMSMNS